MRLKLVLPTSLDIEVEGIAVGFGTKTNDYTFIATTVIRVILIIMMKEKKLYHKQGSEDI